MVKKIRVAELFAGVGGFRLGLEGAPIEDGQPNQESTFKVVFSNQWEPSTKRQHANEVYENRFGPIGHSGHDIASVNTQEIPDHDLLVGGFPCQDYSVATTLRSSKGLQGKKGVLWWQIERILREKGTKAPKYLMLENVDRLLKSPADQRGRDFAVMLASLGQLGYAVEWRVINAADYGMPQRRRRVFILGYHKTTKLYKDLKKEGPQLWMRQSGLFQEAFPAQFLEDPLNEEFELKGSLEEISKDFNKGAKRTKPSPFKKAGVYINEHYVTEDLNSYFKGKFVKLGDVLQSLDEVPQGFIIAKGKSLERDLEDLENVPPRLLKDYPELQRWLYDKGAKKKTKVNRDGFEYTFAEGKMSFPDPLDRPSRTIITGEGGKTASRFKHVVLQGNTLRRLTPIELERLNMFPDNHTALDSITDSKRAFFMGNALVVGVVKGLADTLNDRIQS